MLSLRLKPVIKRKLARKAQRVGCIKPAVPRAGLVSCLDEREEFAAPKSV